MRFLPYQVAAALVALGLGIWAFSAALTVETVQRGYDGVGMEHVTNTSTLEKLEKNNRVPDNIPQVSGGALAGEAYENVQVLGHLTTAEFTRLMAMITTWVSPADGNNPRNSIGEQGCNYCHNPENMASDEKYTKHVSRRMIQMTQHINENWGSHVGGAGVNCWTCHRGNNVPEYIWFDEPPNPNAKRLVGGHSSVNRAGMNVGLASLPNEAFSTFLNNDTNIRVIGPTALPTVNERTIKQTEHTYGLMMHMSTSLGVNCTYCHNSRAMAEWGQSPVTRTKAWYAIRMARNLNAEYLEPLHSRYPEYRLGPTGDAPKANCATCHQGAYKPLLGQDMISMYPGLSKASDYVPEEKAEVEIVDDRIEISQEVYFETGSATVAERSFALLDAIASTMNENPQVRRVEIQGHTDSSGESDANQVLSQERADAVRLYLLDAGVDAERLDAKGYGESQPVESDGADNGEPMNRRVEFVIVEFDVDADSADSDEVAEEPGADDDPAVPAPADEPDGEETP